MRWKLPPVTPALGPQPGDERVREAFLLFPLKIGDEIRWLERAAWIERYIDGWYERDHWETVRWV